jgi:hypothetical protein
MKRSTFIPVSSSQPAWVAGGPVGFGGAIQPSFLQGFGHPVSLPAHAVAVNSLQYARCQNKRRKSILPGETTLGAGDVSIDSWSPSMRSELFRYSFYEKSTLVTKSSPATRSRPLYASIDF